MKKLDFSIGNKTLIRLQYNKSDIEKKITFRVIVT